MAGSQRNRKKSTDCSTHSETKRQSFYPLKSTQLKLPDISLGKDQWMEDSLAASKSIETERETKTSFFESFDKLPHIVPPAIKTLELPLSLSEVHSRKYGAGAARSYHPVLSSTKLKLPSKFCRTLSSGNVNTRSDFQCDVEPSQVDLFCKGTHYHKTCSGRGITNSGIRHLGSTTAATQCDRILDDPDGSFTHRMKMLGTSQSKESIPQLNLPLPATSPSTAASMDAQTAAATKNKEHCLIINFSIPLPTPESSSSCPYNHMMKPRRNTSLHSTNRRLQQFQHKQSSYVKMHVEDSSTNRRNMADHYSNNNIEFNEAEQNVTDSLALKCALDKFIESSTTSSSKFESALNSMRHEKAINSSTEVKRFRNAPDLHPSRDVIYTCIPPCNSPSMPIPVKLVSGVEIDGQQLVNSNSKRNKKGVTLSELKGYLSSKRRQSTGRIIDPSSKADVSKSYSKGTGIKGEPVLSNHKAKLHEIDTSKELTGKSFCRSEFNGEFLDQYDSTQHYGNGLKYEQMRGKKKSDTDKISPCKGQYRLYKGTTGNTDTIKNSTFAIESSSQLQNGFLPLSSRMLNQHQHYHHHHQQQQEGTCISEHRPSYPLKMVGGICRGMTGEIESQRKEGPFNGNIKHWKQLPPPTMSSRLSLLKMSSSVRRSSCPLTTPHPPSMEEMRSVSPWHNSTPSNLMVDGRNGSVQTERYSTPVIESMCARIDSASSTDSVCDTSSTTSSPTVSVDTSDSSISICDSSSDIESSYCGAACKPIKEVYRNSKSGPPAVLKTKAGRAKPKNKRTTDSKTFSYANLKDIGPIFKKKVMQLHDRQCGTIRRERRNKRKSLSISIQKLYKGSKLSFSHSKNFNY